MTYLIAGVLIWSFVHIIPSGMRGVRGAMIRRTSEVAYKAVFALLIVVSIGLMITGWKLMPSESLFETFGWADELCLLLMLATFVLFFAPYVPNNISRYLRHPQLTGIVLWGVGHVLASPSLRSVFLFGGIGVWALIEIFLINHREGTWKKPAEAGFKSNFKLLITGMGFFLLFMFTHRALFGVTAVPH